MKNLLLFTILLCFGITQAQNVNIPDINFKYYLLNYVPSIDTNNDNQIQITEAEAFTGVLSYSRSNYNYITNCQNECSRNFGYQTPEYQQCIADEGCENFNDNDGIKNLTGIEAFVNVSEIDFEYINLTTSNFIATIDFSNFNNLEKISIIFASDLVPPTINIDLSNNTALTEVTLYNYVENIYGSSMGFNFDYYLEYYPVTINNLNLANNTALEKLDVNYMYLEALDLSSNINLIDLKLDNNNLTTLNLDANVNLEKLNLSSNNLSTLNLSTLIDLEDLNLESNNLTTLNLDTNINLNGHLIIFDNNLSSLDITNNPNVLTLSCYNNNLSTLNLNGLTNLESLTCFNNNLTTIDLSTNINLLSLHCGVDDNLINLDLSANVNLTHLTLRYNDAITSLDLSANHNLTSYNLYNNSNLAYVNLKNGNNQNFNQFGIQFQGSTSLQTVCVDDINSNFVTEIQNDVTQSVNFTEYCSLTPATSNQISGNVKYDTNNNGCDASDISLQNIMVTTTNGVDNFATFTQANGDYLLYTNEGGFTTSASQNLPYFTINPATQTSSFIGFDNTDTANFCMEANQTINDANISIFPLTDARPGFDASYQLVYNNIGTTPLNGSVVFEFDNTKLTFLNASETVTSQTTNAITFNYTNLQAFESRIINVDFNVLAPPTTQIDEVLVFIATVNPISGDNTTTDNIYTFNQTVIGSFDPNDIQVVEGDQVLFTDADKYLHYIIRFQNTGTASAINVAVNNELDDKLDWSTLKLENTSHTSRVAITNGKDVAFIFENINLPDSTSDEPNSHGYIAYKIKPKSDVVLGDVISNTADIFFDFNEAIVTNTVSTEFVNTLSIPDFDAANFSIYPNPTNHTLNVESKKTISKLELYNNIGQQVLLVVDSDTVDVSKFTTGLYFIKITDNNGAFQIKKFIKQ